MKCTHDELVKLILRTAEQNEVSQDELRRAAEDAGRRRASSTRGGNGREASKEAVAGSHR
jgi:hypothetical protein